jgi:GT2 family glycosyltransferase
MLSIIIPTWNGLQHLPQSLASLYAQLPPDAEVVLIDNGSSDGTSAWVAEHAAWVRCVRLPHNLGFAGGVNTGLRAARGDLLFLFNDDAFAAPNMLATLLEAASEYPAIGAFAAVLTFAHKPDLIASAGIRMQRDGLALDRWTGRNISELPADAQPILGASGGAVLLRRALLDDIGLLEGSFFNYLEDVDLALRARLRGWETLLLPRAQARHVYSATASQGSPFKQRLLARNRIATIIRCFPGELLQQSLIPILCYDLLAIVYGAVSRQPAIIHGRIAALQTLPTLIAQRHAIQARRTVRIADFAKWLEPARLPWHILAEQQRLDAILAERSHLNDETMKR